LGRTYVADLATTLVTNIREVLGSNLGPDSGFSQSLREMPGYDFDYAITVSFQVLFNSSFILSSDVM
jgi:hypothetical protein